MKKINKKSIIIPTAVGVVALFIGVGIGTSDQPEPEVRTETKTVTKEVEVEVVKVPESCVAAIDGANETMAHLGDALVTASDGVMLAFNRDAAGMESLTADLDGIKASVDASRDQYIIDAADCKIAADK